MIIMLFFICVSIVFVLVALDEIKTEEKNNINNQLFGLITRQKGKWSVCFSMLCLYFCSTIWLIVLTNKKVTTFGTQNIVSWFTL